MFGAKIQRICRSVMEMVIALQVYQPFVMDLSHDSIIKRRKLDVEQVKNGTSEGESGTQDICSSVAEQKRHDEERVLNGDGDADDVAVQEEDSSYLLRLSDEVLLMILERVDSEDIANVFW